MKFGGDLEYFLDIEEATGETPEPLLLMPELPGHLETIYEVFSLLSSCRGHTGFGTILPIPASDILAAADLIEPGDPLRFFRVMKRLDAVVMEHAAREAKRASDAAERERGSKATKRR